jgi:hypothetical protein
MQDFWQSEQCRNLKWRDGLDWNASVLACPFFRQQPRRLRLQSNQSFEIMALRANERPLEADVQT